jgi:hypothetical protein
VVIPSVRFVNPLAGRLLLICTKGTTWLNGLIPKEKKLHLPYTQRRVSMIYFDASKVFALLLSCPTLNQDANYFFYDAKDPFVAPQASSYIGDIHTGHCYKKTYKAHVKKFGIDMQNLG